MDVSAVGLQSAPENLARGSVLRDTYKITDVLSRTALGVTYLAQDLRTENLCAVTEYYPQGLAARTSSGLAAQPGYEAAYSQQLQGFLAESQSLARFQHPNIAAVTDLFTAGGTAYRVVNYEQGRTLTSWLAGLELSPQSARDRSPVRPAVRCACADARARRDPRRYRAGSHPYPL